MTAPAALQEAQFALMRRSGVETVRTAFSWEDAQPRQNEPTNFAPTDRLVELAARHRIELLPVIIYTPFWARIHFYAGFSSRPRRIGDYARFVEELVRRYGPSGSFWDERPDLPRRPLRYWQIWNEPNLPHFWWTGKAGRWTRSYGRLLNASYDAIKRADPGAKVVLGALANESWRDLAAALPNEGAAAVRRRRHQPLHVEPRQHPQGPSRACAPSSIAPATATSRYG